MRKLFIALFALMMGVTFVSCNQAPNLGDIVAKMKTEGANWNEDQWKENLGQAMLAMKPVFEKMAEISKKAEAGDEKALAEMISFAETQEAKDLEKYANEIEKIVSENPVAKKVNEDQEWQKKFREENGIPEM